MAVFDRTTTTSEGNFEIMEFDSTGEEGEFQHSLEISSAEAVVGVLVEGRVDEYQVLLDEVDIRDEEEVLVSESDSRTLITVAEPVPEGRVRLLIHGFLRAGRRAKISVLKLSRRLRRHVSCNACKRFFRFIVSALLTTASAPDVSVGGLIPEEFGGWITEAELPPAATEILSRLNEDPWRQALEALRGIGVVLNEVLTPFDAVLTHLCEAVGACGERA